MGNISTWKDTAAANGTAGSPPDYWPEGQAPSTVNNCAREMMRAIRVQWEEAAWFDYGFSVSLASQNKVRVASLSYGVSNVFITNRRVKVVSNSTTIYGYVSDTSLTASAAYDVTITPDSGTLTSTVTSVAVSIICPTNSPIPGAGAGNSVYIEQDGSQIYAADAQANDSYAITLSPAITSYTTGMVVNFKANTANTGAATLDVNGLGAVTIKKNHDQDLANGDIESGQIVTLVYDGTNFQMQSQLGNTQAATQTWEYIASGTAANSATIDFTGLSSTYFAYKVIFDYVAPASDSVHLWIRTSTDNGSSYDATAGDYDWAFQNFTIANPPVETFAGSAGAADTAIRVLGGMGNGSQEMGWGEVTFINPSNANTYTQVIWQAQYVTAVPVRQRVMGGGSRQTAADVDAIRFMMSSGNISTGNFRLYGIRAS